MSQSRRRIGLLFGLFVALLAFGALRSLYLGAFAAGKLRRAAASQQITYLPVPALRGSILDRNGLPLAVSEPASDVFATPYLVKDPVAAANRLAPLLGKTPDALAAKLAVRTSGFVYLARRVPDATAQTISKLAIPGIGETPTQLRSYPNHTLASQVLGAVGIDDQGLSGLEYLRNRVLRGQDGRREIISDAVGHPISIRDLRAPHAGETLRLTLDAAIQSRVEDVLAGVGATYRPKGSTAIVMDPRTNEILAMANWPRVDANAIGSAPPYALQNRAVSYNYEPGSTFKAVTVAGALSDGLVTPDTTFYLPPQIRVADRTIHDADPRGAETLSVARILAQSSNVGAVTIGLRLGRVRFDQWVRQFGFGSPTRVDLPGEERGQVLPVQRYSGSSMGNLPIGQGESVTPLQIATAYAAIANGGILRPPHIVAGVGGDGVPEPRGHRILTPAVAAELRQMLEGVLAPGGTASEVSIPGYKLAGKTGTANKIDPTTGLYSDTRYIASFVGFAPAQDPKLLVAVMVDEPQSAIYGGTVAAPAFGQIMSFALPYLRIPPG